jgi:metal-dependent HD superfamily phosphatase/phosphodiesterase
MRVGKFSERGISPPEEYGRSVAERFSGRVAINVPKGKHPRLAALLDAVNRDDDLYALWVASNVNAVDRLGMTDHGPVHVKIVMNLALRLLRLFLDRDIEPSIVTNYGMESEDGEIVVAMAALMHDLGMAIHRQDHESFSLFLAKEKLDQLLPLVYDSRTAAIVRSEILHAIIGHRSGGRPLTLEAGIVRIADALDMAKGRSRIPVEAGSVSIHSVSAAAIESVSLEPGEDRPVRIVIRINNSAGMFQLDQLFRDKLQGSGIEEYVELEAVLHDPVEGEARLFKGFRL